MLNALRDYVRPIATAALVAVLLLGAAISGALEAFSPGLGVAFTNGVAGWFKAIPGDFYNLVILGLLGYGAYRTVDKAVGIVATAKYDRPARTVDNPDA